MENAPHSPDSSRCLGIFLPSPDMPVQQEYLPFLNFVRKYSPRKKGQYIESDIFC